MRKITPCLWFDRQAEEAAQFYVSVFPNSRIVSLSRYGEAGHDVHKMPAGTVMVVEFELDGQTFTALNGGPVFQFNEAISLQVDCATQADVDHYWEQLTAGGGQEGVCGWLKDRFGVSWQVVPTGMAEMLMDPDPRKSERAMAAMMKMKKPDIAALRRAHAG